MIAPGTTTTYVHGISFPVETEAMDAMKKLVSGSITYVQVKIDVDGEKIKLDHTATIPLSDLSKQIHLSEPRFHFFAYKHDFEGQNITSYGKTKFLPKVERCEIAAPFFCQFFSNIARFYFFETNSKFFFSKKKISVFVYSCPDGSGGTKATPVKLRMLYSSSKAAVAEILTQNGGKADARLEVASPEDLDEDLVISTLHPQKEEKKAAFARPMRPGKGGARLTTKKQ